jgi:hypothetical protein
MGARAKKKASLPVPAGEPRIEEMSLTDLHARRLPGNAKRHDLEVIGESFEEHGMVDLPGIDETTGLMFRGHGRLEKLEKMKADGEKPPARVKMIDGDWVIPVVRGYKFKDREAVERYALVDNRATELGGWDNTILSKQLAKFGEDNLIGTGFDSSDLVRFMKSDSGPKIPDMKASYTILVECRHEREQTKLIKRFQGLGLKVRALIS